MTKDDIYFYTQAKKELEFKYHDTTYVLNYDKTSDGKDIIIFGPLYNTKKFDSYGDLMNNARVENHYFKEFIEVL